MPKQFFVYIMTNSSNSTLYTGVTSDLQRRVYEHREKFIAGFTQKYNLTKLVYFEEFGDSYSALSREKQIKGGSRQKKIDLINVMNKGWEDLFPQL